MITVARILLALAALITLLVALVVADAHPVGGADAMGLIVVIPVLMAQWIVLAGVVGAEQARKDVTAVLRERVAPSVPCG